MRSTTSLPQLPGLRDYEILEKIAEGSMASIWKARHRNAGTLAAVKIPHTHVMSNRVLRERFRKEFRAGNVLNHPNIVRMLDFGEEGDTFHLVMEYVDGSDLWERISREGRLPEGTAVDIIVQAAKGLHEAHQYGIIHRDVKPDNILLTRDGVAKLGDLGLIKELEAELELTSPDKGLGTPNFMAPEQFKEAHKADVRCDVYSLGATLYMAVTGQLPFAGENMSVMLRKKLNNDLPPPRSLVPTLSERLDWAVRRAVQVDPTLRHSSCLEFIEALTGRKASGVHARRSGLRKKRLQKERRRSVRHDCTLSTVCELLTSIHSDTSIEMDRWTGKVVNLSAEGVGLLLSRRFEQGTLATVVLESPDRSFQIQRDIRVVRAAHSREREWYMGAVFVMHLETEELRKLL
jgi:serine/threonine protein kinase